MTTLAFLAGTTLLVAIVRWWLNWSQDRTEARMLREVAKIKARHQAGITSSDVHDPQVPSDRAGVEQPVAAPPAHPSVLVGAAQRPHASAPTRRPVFISALTPAGAGDRVGSPAPAGHHRV